MRERTIWISAGLLGLAVAVALAVLTSHVSQPPVGVPGEPVSAGQQLAPARTATPARSAPARPPARKSTTTTPAAPPATPAPQPRDDDDHDDADDDGDNSGSAARGDDDSGKGRGRGRGGDD